MTSADFIRARMDAMSLHDKMCCCQISCNCAPIIPKCRQLQMMQETCSCCHQQSRFLHNSCCGSCQCPGFIQARTMGPCSCCRMSRSVMATNCHCLNHMGCCGKCKETGMKCECCKKGKCDCCKTGKDCCQTEETEATSDEEK